MSDLLQPGQHPDADQLNAFVEHTLPAHEREKTLAHLASCTACREIVSLSLPPLKAAPLATAPLVEAQPVEVSPAEMPWLGGWFSGWRLAWIGAPAFAALVVLAIYVHNGSRSRGQIASTPQVAEAHPPSPETKGATEDEPAAPKKPSVSASPAKVRKRSPSRAEPLGESVPENGRELKAGKAYPSSAQSIGGPLPLTANLAGMAGMAGGVVPGRNAVSPQRAAPAAPFSPLPSSSSGQATPTAASVNSSQATTPTSNGSTPANNLAAMAAAPAGQMLGLAPRSAFARGGFISTLAPLPSGQPILSFAASLHKLVVLDTQNGLFYSQDEGRHWKQVSPAWKGRAIAVERVASVALPMAARTPAATSFALGVPERFKAGALASAQPSAEPDSLGSSLSGTITDPGGAAIPGATVIVQEGRYAIVRTEKTDSAGHYLFRNLAPGSYRIDAQAPGFQKQSLVENLAASEQGVRNVTLSVGQVSQTVTVDAASVQLETQRQTESISVDKAKSVEATTSAKAHTAVFVITTDAGDMWTSTDGLTWTHE